MPNILGPDGRVVAFPEGMGAADIASVFGRMNIPTASVPGGTFSSQIPSGYPISPDLVDMRNESEIHKKVTAALGYAGDVWKEMKREASGQ